MSDLGSLEPAVIATSLGIVLSALIAALGYYRKLRHERLRTTRVVLFYLLRLYVSAATSMAALSALPRGLAAAAAHAMRVNGVHPDEETILHLASVVASSMRGEVSRSDEEVESEVCPRLELALVDLARDDPLLSLRLSQGRGAAMGERRGANSEGQPSGASYADEVTDSMALATLESRIRRLKGDCRVAALHCGVLTRLDVEFTIQRLARIDGAALVEQAYRDALSVAASRIAAAVAKAHTTSKAESET